MSGAGTHRPLPVTIIGGYLGAGKTTLVNHLLRAADGVRLAVLVNEFGELPIDGDLVEGQSGNVISIAGGCVCCSYGNDLIFALKDLVDGDLAVDHVLLEASGVAIPGAIGATVALLGDYVLDGIVVVGDAETLRRSAGDRYMGDTVRAQLGDADIVILNKADLVSEAALDDLEAWLGEMAPDAAVVTATRGNVAPAVVLTRFLGRERGGAGRRSEAVTHGHYETTRFDGQGPTDPDAFAEDLIEQGYLRAKGFVRDRSGNLVTVQVVGRRAEVSPAPAGVRPGVVAIRPIR